jgi:hypothetical protein
MPLDPSSKPSAHTSGLSTSKYYEPKFLQLFACFRASTENTGSSINLDEHLMTLCLDFLIPLCCWCRSGMTMSTWIRTILEDNPDLRPEVRNGMAMIVIYTLSAAKAEHLGSEMFLILQDAQKGLGIVNKTSLKIYNDPYNYFTFLKSSISGLIDAGCIPENERSNQPKKSKRHLENKEEVAAFMQLKMILSHFISHGDGQGCRIRIQNILSVWQHRNKVIRNRRFSTALALMSAPQPPTSLLPAIMSFPPTSAAAVPQLAHIPLAMLAPNDPMGLRLIQSSNALTVDVEDNQGLGHDKSGRLLSVRSPSLGEVPYLTNNRSIRPPAKSTSSDSVSMAAMSSASPMSSALAPPIALDSNNSNGSDHDQRPKKQLRSFAYDMNLTSSAPALPRASIPGMRFERVGQGHWELHEFAIFDIEAFLVTLSQTNATICLLDESTLTASERGEKVCQSSLQGFVSLHSELRHRRGLLTSWHPADHAQLKVLLTLFKLQENNSQLSPASLLAAVWKHASGYAARSPYEATTANAVLVYEILVQVGVVVRIEDQEAWNLFYPRALFQTNASKTTLRDFLLSAFPQLATLLEAVDGSKSKGWVVKYCPHIMRMDSSAGIRPPAQPSIERYRTIGDVNQASSIIFGQLDPSVSFHDFVLLRST